MVKAKSVEQNLEKMIKKLSLSKSKIHLHYFEDKKEIYVTLPLDIFICPKLVMSVKFI